jgi:hypothetical protein
MNSTHPTFDQNLAEAMEKRQYLRTLLKDWTVALHHATNAEDKTLERQKKQHVAEVGTAIKPETIDHGISSQIKICIQTVKVELRETKSLIKRVRAAQKTWIDLNNPAANGSLR